MDESDQASPAVFDLSQLDEHYMFLRDFASIILLDVEHGWQNLEEWMPTGLEKECMFNWGRLCEGCARQTPPRLPANTDVSCTVIAGGTTLGARRTQAEF